MRVDQLTFTRFIAAVLVILFHHYRFLPMMHYTNVFVSYFFVLSGFVLAVSQKSRYQHKEDYLLFYTARASRIFPLFLLATLLAVLTGMNAELAGPFNLFLNITGLQSFFPGRVMSYNYPSWSISVELFFYLCFPFLVRFVYNKLSLKKVLGVGLALWAVTQVAVLYLYEIEKLQPSSTKLHDFLFYFPLLHLNQFVAGNILGLLFLRFHKKWTKNYDLHLVVLSMALLGYLNFFRPRFDLFDHNGLLIFLFAPFILLLALNTGKISKIFAARPLIILGEVSFGLYLLAEPLLKGMETVAQTSSWGTKPYFHFALIIILIIATLVYFFFEKPLQQVLKNFFRKMIGPVKTVQPLSKPVIIKLESSKKKVFQEQD
jgi:peptidoglycan/LPS O-acetylase OafA/YrhL